MKAGFRSAFFCFIMMSGAVYAEPSLSSAPCKECLMDIYLQAVTIAGIFLVALASPGPDFAVILRMSLRYGRRVSLMTSVGVGAGILIHVAYSLLGVGLLISKSILAFTIMKWAGALYLVYLGFQALRAKPAKAADVSDILDDQTDRGAPGMRRAFLVGFLTNGLNPKATLFFLSLFTVIIDPATPLTVQIAYGGMLSIMTGLWFSGLSLVLSSAPIVRAYRRIGHWLDRTFGAMLIALGVHIALSDAPSSRSSF